jgi:hypothetical protein
MPPNPTVTVTADSDAIVDLVRGVEPCEAQWARHPVIEEGDSTLLFLAGVNMNAGLGDDFVEYKRKAEAVIMRRMKDAVRAAKDPIDAFSGRIEVLTRAVTPMIADPVFIRATFSGPPPVEVLYHFEAGKLNVLRGRPGETLLPGALELKIDALAARVLGEDECDLFFALKSLLVRVEGDVDVLRQVGIVTHPEALDMVRYLMKTGKPLSIDNEPPAKVVGDAPAVDPWL